MALYASRKEGESVGSVLFRFNKKVKQSGIMKEAKKRRFRARPLNRGKIRAAALYREKKQAEFRRLKKHGRTA